MEENKGKKENRNNMKKIIVIGISIICIIAIIVGIVITRNNKKTEISSNLEETKASNVVEGTTLFEDIGHYSVAVAGNNNADRGTSFNTNIKLISSYPENWDEIKKNIPSNILSRVNNMSGSRLDFTGKVKGAWITSYFASTSSRYTGDILIIKPDGSYEVIYGKSSQTVPINISDSGWYYVSLLSSSVTPQQAWAITIIYENYNLPINYINLIYGPYDVNGSKQINYIELYYSNKLKLKDKFGLFGVIILGGYGAWPVTGKTEDKVEAILSDGTYKQLYQGTYNGKTIFSGRTSTDFVNGIINTVRSHNTKGGELDVFYEELGKDYFNNREVLGYKITKTGTDGFNIQVLGLSQEIYSPEFLFNIENTSNNILENESIHIKTNVTNSATDEESIGYDTKITCKLDEALSEVTNIVVKINGNVINVESVYNADTNEIVINGIDEIYPSQAITVEYDVKVNSNIQNKVEENDNIKLPILVNVKSYPIDINTLEESEQEKYRELYVETEDEIFITLEYRTCTHTDVEYTDNGDGTHNGVCEECGEIVANSENHIDMNSDEFCDKCGAIIEKPVEVIVKYIDEVTGEEIENRSSIIGFKNDGYETNSKEIDNYKLVSIPENARGVIGVEDIVVTYKYRKLSKVTIKYIDLISGNDLEKIEEEYKEGEPYIIKEKEIDGYKLINVPQNVTGVIERNDIEVIFGYKKISGGVIVKHIDRENNEVIKEEKIEGVVGEKYSTRKLDLQKYNFIEVIGNIEGNLSEEATEVIYYYEKKQAVVEIIYEDENGKEIYKEIIEGKVGEKYKVEVKEIENYNVVDTPENIEGEYGIDEIVVRIRVEKIKVKVEINIVDENGSIIETIEKEGYIGDIEEVKLPEIDGYYTDDKSITIEYGKENNINVVYKKKLFDLPNTSDINIYVYIGIFVVSIIVISILIINKVKKHKK